MGKGAFLRELTEAIAERAAPEAAAAEKKAMRLYHGTEGGTPKRYTEIKSPRGFYKAHAHQGFDELSADQNWDQLGLHMGSPKQANSFAGLAAEVSDEDLAMNPDYYANRAKDRGRVIPLDVEMANPLRLEDRSGSWKPVEVYDQLVEQQKIVDDPDVRHQLWKQQIGGAEDQMSAMQQIREMIENAGHDGVVYLNRVEGLPFNERFSALQRAEQEGFSPEKMTDDDIRKYLPDAQDSYITWNKDKYRSPFGEGTGAGWAEGGPVSPLQAAYRR